MGDWGKRIRLTYDGPVYNLASADAITKFRLVEVTYGTYIYPISVTYGATTSELYLEFDNFNSAVGYLQLEYLGGINLGGIDIPFDPWIVDFWATNLHPPGEQEFVMLSDISIAGVIDIAFDGKIYEDEYVILSTITISADVNAITYSGRYSSDYVQLSTVTIAGQYCDINGNPL